MVFATDRVPIGRGGRATAGTDPCNEVSDNPNNAMRFRTIQIIEKVGECP